MIFIRIAIYFHNSSETHLNSDVHNNKWGWCRYSEINKSFRNIWPNCNTSSQYYYHPPPGRIITIIRSWVYLSSLPCPHSAIFSSCLQYIPYILLLIKNDSTSHILCIEIFCFWLRDMRCNNNIFQLNMSIYGNVINPYLNKLRILFIPSTNPSRIYANICFLQISISICPILHFPRRWQRTGEERLPGILGCVQIKIIYSVSINYNLVTIHMQPLIDQSMANGWRWTVKGTDERTRGQLIGKSCPPHSNPQCWCNANQADAWI